ncbi:hypothetical protein GCM10027188_07590 [Lysobacter humi (ex Lee et al. 2017)]
MDLARARDRADDVGRELLGLLEEFGGDCVHSIRPLQGAPRGGDRKQASGKASGRRADALRPAKLPYGGLNRIRFEGSVSTGR